MTHTLIIEPGFRGLDGFCEDCYDPSFDEGSWGGYSGVYNATREDVEEWFENHVIEQEEV